MKKTINKAISLTPRQLEMVNELQDKFGASSFSATIQSCIAFTHMKRFPDNVIAKTKNNE